MEKSNLAIWRWLPITSPFIRNSSTIEYWYMCHCSTHEQWSRKNFGVHMMDSNVCVSITLFLCSLTVLPQHIPTLLHQPHPIWDVHKVRKCDILYPLKTLSSLSSQWLSYHLESQEVFSPYCTPSWSKHIFEPRSNIWHVWYLENPAFVVISFIVFPNTLTWSSPKADWHPCGHRMGDNIGETAAFSA